MSAMCVAAVAVLISGCATTSETDTAPSSSSSPQSSETAEPTPSATATEEPRFTDAELAQTCIDATVSVFAPDVEFDIDATRIEHRIVEPEWLVLVPASTGGQIAESQCTIGGTPLAPVIEMSSGSIDPLPEEQIQRLIRGENEGGTE